MVWSALFDLVCLVWFRMVWTVCADSFVLVCVGLVEAVLLQAGLFSLGSVLSRSLWYVLVLPTLLYFRLVYFGLFGWFVLVQLGLVYASLSYLLCPRWVGQAT